jgi:hypothetical protein
VYQITLRDFDLVKSNTKTLTPTLYARIGEEWRARYGVAAGWAQTVLFAADISRFKPRVIESGALGGGGGKGKKGGRVREVKKEVGVGGGGSETEDEQGRGGGDSDETESDGDVKGGGGTKRPRR